MQLLRDISMNNYRPVPERRGSVLSFLHTHIYTYARERVTHLQQREFTKSNCQRSGSSRTGLLAVKETISIKRNPEGKRHNAVAWETEMHSTQTNRITHPIISRNTNGIPWSISTCSRRRSVNFLRRSVINH